jgi:hypothetical protein
MRRKISSVSSNRPTTSPHMASSRPVAILPLAALVAPEAHIRTALVLQVASLAVLDHSPEGHRAHLACRRLEHRLQAGSLPARASTSRPVLSHRTCRLVLWGCTTRVRRSRARGAVRRKVSKLPQRPRLQDKPR